MNKTFILMITMSLMLMPVLANADDQAAAPGVETVSAVVEVGNKICPVSNEEVGGMGDVVKVEHNGKAYNLCCAMCEKDFAKDPDKYAKIADDEVKAEVSKD